MLRPGNAQAHGAEDQIAVLEQALEQLPREVVADLDTNTDSPPAETAAPAERRPRHRIGWISASARRRLPHPRSPAARHVSATPSARRSTIRLLPGSLCCKANAAAAGRAFSTALGFLRWAGWLNGV